MTRLREEREAFPPAPIGKTPCIATLYAQRKGVEWTVGLGGLSTWLLKDLIVEENGNVH